MTLVYALYVPNAPNLIAPDAFGGVGADTVRDLEALDLVRRFRPEVILVASPHWVSPGRFLVQVGERPRQVYDFSGFPRELSSVKYEPAGSPELARALVAAGTARGLPVEGSTEWGLDHGAWAPLMHIAPGGRVPVVPLSTSTAPALDHLTWGKVVGDVLENRSERVVFVSTGSILHSFSRMDPSATGWPEGERIEKEIVDLIVQGRYQELAGFDRRKWATIEPEGELGPFFIMAGAMGRAFRARVVSTHPMWGAFSLTILEFTRP